MTYFGVTSMTYKYLANKYEKMLRDLLDNGYDREDEEVVEVATVLMAINKQVQVNTIFADDGPKVGCLRCPRCKHDFEKKSNYCPECGQKVKV